jgi:hypothetical protein
MREYIASEAKLSIRVCDTACWKYIPHLCRTSSSKEYILRINSTWYHIVGYRWASLDFVDVGLELDFCLEKENSLTVEFPPVIISFA